MFTRLPGERFFRVFLEFRHAMLAAEIISLSVVFVLSRRRPWLYRHTADGVDSEGFVLLEILSMKLWRKKSFRLFLKSF